MADVIMQFGSKRKRVPADRVEYFRTKHGGVVVTDSAAPKPKEPGVIGRALRGDLPLLDEEAMALGAKKGITAGFDDDLAAAAAQVGAGTGRLMEGGNAAQAIGDAAAAGKEAAKAQRAATEAAYERSPISYGLGFIPSALVMGRAGGAPAGASKARQAAGFALPGAAAGVGMGDAESLPEAGLDAVIGAGLGVAGGFAAPQILRAVKGAGGKLRDVLRAKPTAPAAPPSASPVPSEVPLPSPSPPMTVQAGAQKVLAGVERLPPILRAAGKAAFPERAKAAEGLLRAASFEDDAARRAREFSAQLGDETPDLLKPPTPPTPAPAPSAPPPSSPVPEIDDAAANLVSPVSNKAVREALDAELEQVGAAIRSGQTPEMGAAPEVLAAVQTPKAARLTEPGRVLRKRVQMPAPRPDPEAMSAPVPEVLPPDLPPTVLRPAASLPPEAIPPSSEAALTSKRPIPVLQRAPRAPKPAPEAPPTPEMAPQALPPPPPELVDYFLQQGATREQALAQAYAILAKQLATPTGAVGRQRAAAPFSGEKPAKIAAPKGRNRAAAPFFK